MRIRYGAMAVFYVILALLIPLSRWAIHAQGDAPDILLEAQTVNIEMLGQIGDYGTQVIAIQGQFAYIGIGPRLTVVDLADPTHPVVLDQSVVLPQRVLDIKIAGSYAYVATGDSGIHIFDVSTPLHLVRVGGYQQAVGFNAFTLEVRGSYAYVSTGANGLIILDVSDPAKPTKIGKYGGEMGAGDSLPIYVTNVALVDHYAYTISSYYYSSLHIVDVTDPTTPAQVGTYHALFGLHDYIFDIAVVDQRAYLVSAYLGLQILDVSDPEAPALLGSYTPPGPAMKIAVAQGYAYVASMSNGLRILNVTDPTAPIETSFYMPPGPAMHVAADANHVYVAAEGGGLHILDTSNPHAPAAIGTYDTPWWYARQVVLADGYAFLAAIPQSSKYPGYAAPSSLGVLSAMEASSAAGEETPPPTSTPSIRPTPTPPYDSYQRNTELYAVNVITPTSPSWNGEPFTTTGILDITGVDNRIYAVDRQGVLNFIDVSNPDAPVVLGSFDLGFSPYIVPCYPDYCPYYYPDMQVAASGRYAYVTDYRLHVIDVADPAMPARVGLYEDVRPLDLATDGRYVYVAEESGLLVIDVSDPAQPKARSYFPSPWPVMGVRVADGYAYMVVGSWYGSNSLRILDVSDLDNLREVGSYATPGTALAIAIAGDYAYVADSQGLRIFNVSNPTRPVVAAAFDSINPVTGVAVSGDEVYLAAGDSGLIILRFAPATWAILPPSGGVLRSPFDHTTYIFSAGTFTESVTLKHTIRSAATMPDTGDLAGIGHFSEASAQTDQGLQLQPTKPYQLEIQYRTAEIGGVIEQTLALYFWNGANWIKEPTSKLDAANRKVTATPQQLGRWALLGETHRMYMPVISGAR